MPDKHYVGEVGTELVVKCGRDLTGAASLKLSVKRPDGSVVEWTGERAFQRKDSIRYITKRGDFNVAGEYELQSKVDLNGWEGKGKTAKFLIYEQFA
jgi:hypothetical protein